MTVEEITERKLAREAAEAAPRPEGFESFEGCGRSEKFDKIAAALANFQNEVPAPEKNKTNTHLKTKYADLSSVITTIRPYLHKYGLVYAQPLDYTKDAVVIYTELMHPASGQFIRSRMSMNLTDTKPQTSGIAISYARRYSLLATLAMPHDDEDNNGEMGAEKKKDPKYGLISTSEPKPIEAPKKTGNGASPGANPGPTPAAAQSKAAPFVAPAAKSHDSLVSAAQETFAGAKTVADTRKPDDGAPLADEAKDDLWDLVCQVWPSDGKAALTDALKNRGHKPMPFKTLTVGQGRIIHQLVSEMLGNDGSGAPF